MPGVGTPNAAMDRIRASPALPRTGPFPLPGAGTRRRNRPHVLANSERPRYLVIM